MSVELTGATLKLPDAKQLGDAFRAVRDKYVAEGGTRLLQVVQNSVRASGMTIRTGAVVRWQTIFPHKGYVAVRAEASSSGANSPGAITNYLESGHRIRRPSGKAQRYVPRIRTVRVGGFGFYASAQIQADAIAAEIAARAATEIAEKIGK